MTFRPLAEQVNSSLIQERVVAIMSGFFGGLALLLAGLGLYGVTSYAVNRRRTETGHPDGARRRARRRDRTRPASGWDSGSRRRGCRRRHQLAIGRFVSTLLYGLEPHDPVTLAAAAACSARSARWPDGYRPAGRRGSIRHRCSGKASC